jgi:uncharacterized protein DUF6151
MDHPLQCRCGTLKGVVSHPEEALRGECYCRDCQAFARYLGKAGDVLDKKGGTDVIAIPPKYVTFTQGSEALACMSLSPKGLLRWYASCCNTAIGNTPRNFRISHVGLIHTCLQSPGKTVEGSFGPVRMRAGTKNANGPVKAMRARTVISVLGFIGRLIRARLDGSYKITPFFDAERGTPLASPKVLTLRERERLTNA